MILDTYTNDRRRLLDPQIVLQSHSAGPVAWSGRPSLMGVAHQHDDLEINFVVGGGSMLYVFGDGPVEVGAGQLAVFWAAIPHQLVAGSAELVHWVEVPFGTFLSWGLAESAVHRLLAGTPMVSAPGDVLATDEPAFERWVADLASAEPERERIAMLEVEARLRRLVLRDPVPPAAAEQGGDPGLLPVTAMARYIAQRFREPLTVADIAHAAGLHPNYAMTRFRATLRMTIGDYLTRCRLAEARRLLVVTGLPVERVAASSGFGSVSRFYATFTAACGMPPARFRREYRPG